jgi:hypothetical protein
MDPRPRRQFDRPLGGAMRRMAPLRIAAVFFFLLGTAFLSGCANVKPWEHDILALPAMQLDSDPAITVCDDHIYFSREASKGGRGFGGGGCGCN